MVHEVLECGGGISESEEHYSGLEEAEVCAKSGFPFISFFDYESLNANLRLVFLTRVSEQKFDP